MSRVPVIRISGRAAYDPGDQKRFSASAAHRRAAPASELSKGFSFVTREIPYEIACDCGAIDQGSNARGPRHTRCRACRWGRVQKQSKPTNPYGLRHVMALRASLAPPAPPEPCRGCGAQIQQPEGKGRPRAFCAACRPQKPHADASAKVRDERLAWKAAHPGTRRPQ